MWGRRRSRRFAPHIPRSPGRRLALGLVVALVAAGFYYFGQRRAFRPPAETPLRMTVEQEVALGSRAASSLVRRHGGLDPDQEGQALVQRIGERLVARSEAGKTPYRFTFHLLADTRTVDLYALPGGSIFMTAGLAARLRTEGEFAALLAHAVAHVAQRHPARRIEETHPEEDIPSAEALADFDLRDSTRAGYAQAAALVAEAVNVAFAPEEEAEADARAVAFMVAAGYDPRALMSVVERLEQASVTGRSPAFLTTHPGTEHRLDALRRIIDRALLNATPGEVIN